MNVQTPAPLDLQPLDPREHRDEIVELFRRNGETDHVTCFDWHFADDACASRAWCLRTMGARIVGFIALFERVAHFGTDAFRVGIPGDLLVDRAHRSLHAVLSLVRAPLRLVDQNELDAVLAGGGVGHRGYGALTDRLIRRLGYRAIGRWQPYTLLLHSKTRAHRRFGMSGSMFSPLIDLRSRYKLGRYAPSAQYEVRELPAGIPAELVTVSWNQKPLLSVHYPPRQLAWRFLGDPHGANLLLGIFDAAQNCAGYAAASLLPDGTLRLLLLHVDEQRLAERDAIALIARSADCDAISISILEKSELGADLRALGFIPRPAAGFPVAAYWKPSLELWGLPERWQVFQGFQDV